MSVQETVDMKMKIYTGCISDRGNYREKNQDRAVCCRRVGGRKAPLAVACVCDGIGSLEQSEISSEMVTNGIKRWFAENESYYPGVLGEAELAEDLEDTIRELNELVYEYQLNNGIEIGCTMSALLLTERVYHIFHVGDSRIYRVRKALCQLTRDETSVYERDGKERSLLMNYIGKAKELWLNRLEGTLEGSDLFLLGSDGLFKMLGDEDVAGLERRLTSDRHVRKVCKDLVKSVLKRGERDNVSCILINAVFGKRR